MNKLLLDLWHDLRAKRLWPVAALLVVALVAVPIALHKGSSSGSSPAAGAASAPAAPADSKAVVVADTNSAKNSNLNDFSTKNPFEPDHAVLAAAHPKPAAPTQTSTPSGGSGSGSGSGGATPPSTSHTGGSVGGGVPVQVQPTQPKLTFYGYTIDLKFGKFGSTTLHRGVQKLAILPNQTKPLLVFLGVNTAENTAVFLLDSKLTAAGEGSCKPSANTCSFLYLKLDPNHNSEELSLQNADGTSTDYSVELLAIHRVPLDQLKQSAKTAAQKAARQAAQRAGRPSAPTPFEVPFGVSVQPDVVG